MAFDFVTAAIQLIDDGLKAFIPDATTRLQTATQLAMAQNQLVLAQIELNKVEAASTNLFVSGWRPAIGWVCAGAYLYTFVIQPFLVFTMSALGHEVPTLPKLEMFELGTILFGLLGLGSMRSVEKIQGVTK